METQESPKTPWVAPTFERTALNEAVFNQGQFTDGDGWDSTPDPQQ